MIKTRPPVISDANQLTEMILCERKACTITALLQSARVDRLLCLGGATVTLFAYLVFPGASVVASGHEQRAAATSSSPSHSPSVPEIALFPIQYSSNGKYLVDQNGAPFPIMGRTAWFVVSLSVDDYHTFVDDTAARGYD